MAALNVFSVDLEGWYQSLSPDPAPVPLEKQKDGIREGIEKLLSLLDRRGAKATWFTLGQVAELMPDDVRAIARAGHEIASHGQAHDDVFALGPEKFREDLARSQAALTEAAGARPAGYRAPKWSAGRAGPWYFDALRQAGYAYDSSLNRAVAVGARGMREDVHRIAGVVEIPPMTVKTVIGWLPGGGSVGLRNLTHRVILKRAQALNAAGEPAVFWVHPWEVAQRRLAGRMPLPVRLMCNTARVDLAKRVERLLGELPFGTASAALADREKRGPLPEIPQASFRSDAPKW